MEPCLRDALFRDAKRILEDLLNDRALLPDHPAPAFGETLYRNRSRQIHTLFGIASLSRHYYHHAPSKSGRAPLDEILDLTRGYTPALARLVCHASSQSESYQQGADNLQAYTGLNLDSRGFGRLIGELAPTLQQGLASLPAQRPNSEQQVPAILYLSCDGTGVPFRRDELQGVKGKQLDGTSRTREAKLGCVFTQTIIDENARPIRDPDSTSYVGTFAGCREAGTLLRQEALRRGYASIAQSVYLGDGAPWIWENARLNFPDAVQILDFYHASEHLGELTSALWEKDSAKAKSKQKAWSETLKRDSARNLITVAKRLLSQHRAHLSESAIEVIDREISYFQTNQHRTRYGLFQKQGYFIGSGVIEAGCKTVIGRRMKQSGMFWGEDGAESMLELRCLTSGPHLEAAWQARRTILTNQRRKARRWINDQNQAA